MLRDDVQSLISNLKTLYSKKLSHVKQLQLQENDKLHYLKTENSDKFIEIADKDEFIIQEIDRIDAIISSHQDTICAIIGVDRDRLQEYLNSLNDETINLINQYATEIKENFSKLIEMRKELIHLMEIQSEKIQKDIREFIKIDVLQINSENL